MATLWFISGRIWMNPFSHKSFWCIIRDKHFAKWQTILSVNVPSVCFRLFNGKTGSLLGPQMKINESVWYTVHWKFSSSFELSYLCTIVPLSFQIHSTAVKFPCSGTFWTGLHLYPCWGCCATIRATRNTSCGVSWHEPWRWSGWPGKWPLRLWSEEVQAHHTLPPGTPSPPESVLPAGGNHAPHCSVGEREVWLMWKCSSLDTGVMSQVKLQLFINFFITRLMRTIK